MFKIGDATITRIEETYGVCYPLRDIFPEFNDAHMAEHKSWLAPNHYDADSGLIKLSVHSWLLKVGGKTILIDSCCGNDKIKPGRPWWNKLNINYLERLAAAGARPEDIDLVMCTHLHHDHVGWNTQEKDGKWMPTFPNARYVFNKPDIDYFSKIDADPKEGPAELGTFRECVVPILEYGKADVIAGAHRINDFIEIDTAPGHSPGHVFFKLESKGERAAFIGDVWHHLLAGLLPRLEFPEKFRRGSSQNQPAQGARLLRLERRAGDARPRRRAVRRPRREDGGWLPAGFQRLKSASSTPSSAAA